MRSVIRTLRVGLRRSGLFLLTVGPTLVLALWAARAFQGQIDAEFGRLTPVVAVEASRYLGRDVRIGAIGPDLTLKRLIDLWRHPETAGTFPVSLNDIVLGARPDERASVGGPTLASARRITLHVSATGLTGKRVAQEALPLVRVEGLDLSVVRAADQSFPLERLVPDDGRPKDPSLPPFLTRIEVEDSRLRFRDFGARPGGPMEENALVGVHGSLDLSGARMARFQAVARAQPGTPTAARLGGALSVDGAFSRGEPGTRPDAPAAETPLFYALIKAADAALPYWQKYWAPTPGLDLQAGRGDARVSLVAPRGPKPVVMVMMQAVFRGVRVRHDAAPAALLTDAAGELAFDDSVLGVSVRGRVFGGPVRADAQLWDLNRPGVTPKLAARVDAPSLPVRALIAAAKAPILPRELALGETVSVRDLRVGGPLDRLRADGAVGLDRIGWPGLPALRELKAGFAWGDGLLAVEGLTGRADGGGSVSARVRFRPGVGALQVSAKAEGIDLRRIAALRFTKDPRLAVAGIGSAEVTGEARRKGDRWTPSGNAQVHADGLRVGRLSLPAATAQLRFDGTRVQIVAARVGGPVGVAGLRGTVDLGGLSLQGSLVGVDLGRLGDALSVPGLDGVGSVTVAVEGPLASPVVTLRDLSVLGPRLRVEDRLLNADAVRCEEVRIALRKNRTIDASLIRPARISLYPAELVVSGQMRGPLDEPQLELSGQVENLDFGRIVQLAGGQPARYAPALLRDNPAFVSLTRDLGWADEPPPVAGRVIQASVRVTGTLKHPRAAGRMALRQMRVGRYPIDSGDAEFAYQDGGVTLRNVRATASAGVAQGEARLSPDGIISGRFEIAALKLEALSPLAEPVTTLAGTLKVSATVSGDLNHPTLSAETTAVGEVRIAGVVLTGLRVGKVQAALDRTKDGSTAAELTAEGLQGGLGGAQLAVRRLSFSLPGRSATVDARVTGGTVGGVIRALRDAPREETTLGEALQKAADAIPDAVDGQLDIALAGRTDFSDEGKPLQAHATATLTSKDLTLGPTRFTSFGAEASLDERRLTISKLSLENASALIDGGGTIDLPEKSGDPFGLDVRLESVQPSLDLVRAFLPDFALQGTLDNVSVVAQGTTDDPKVQATLEGTNLTYRPAGRPGLAIDHIRLNSQLRRDADGDLLLTLDDGLIQRGAQEVRLDVALPVDRDQRRILASRPIRKMELRLKDLDLPTLASAADLPLTGVAGALNGRIAVEGSLNQPRLAGQVRLKGATATFPRVGAAKREPLNAISALDIQADLAGGTITLHDTRLALGPTPGVKPKPGGEVTVAGDIQLENLEDFTQLFMRRTAGAAAPQLKGRFNLSANLVNLRPDVDNLSAVLGIAGGLGEQGTGVLNGTVTVTGPLLTPSIATAPDRPLRLVDGALRMPRANAAPGTRQALVFDPRLAIQVEVASDARVVLLDSLAAQLGFQGRGNVGLAGSLSSPRVNGTLTPTGGVLRYPLARLDIRRGGVAQLSYSAQAAGASAPTTTVTLSGVTAEGRITGVVGGSNRRNTETGIINTGLSASSARNESVTYRIRAELNGVIDLAKLTSGDFLQQLTLTSNPPLSKQEIIELLGAQRQLDMIFSGGSQKALRDITGRITDAGVFDRVFDPFNRQVRDILKVDEFNFSFNPDGTTLFRIARRLPEPLDRFSIDLSRTFATRSTSSQNLDFRYGINYELFQLGKAGRYQPRLLLGAELSSERRFPFYFVRGTVNY